MLKIPEILNSLSRFPPAIAIFLLILILITFVFTKVLELTKDLVISTLATIVVAVIGIIASIIGTHLMIRKYHREERAIEFVVKELEQNLKNKELQLKTLDILSNYNPDLSKFFKILEEKGIKIVKDLEEELIQKQNCYFIFSWGENPQKPKLREVYNELKKLLKSSQGSYEKTLFSLYIDYLKSRGYKIFRLFPPMNAFVFIPQDSITVDELWDQIKKGYWDFVEKKVNELSNPKFREWFREFKADGGPIIVISSLYKMSILNLIDLIEKSYRKDDKKKISKKELDELIKEIAQHLEQKIKIYEIKLSYLFEAVDFPKDIINEFEAIENIIVEKLMFHYRIDDKTTYFSEFMQKTDFWNVFVQILQNENKMLYNRLKNDARFERLANLIKSLQIHIFGVNLPNALECNTEFENIQKIAKSL